MIRLISTLLCLLIALSSITAQEYKLSGLVINNDNSPVNGATVLLLSNGKTSITNEYGQFTLTTASAEEQTIVVSAEGHFDISKTTQPGSDNLSITLTPLNISIDEVEISANSIFSGKEGWHDVPGAVTFLDAKELDKFRFTNVNATLATVPGVNLQEEDGYGLRPNIGLRGTGSERSSKITIMEDGVLAAPAPYAAPAAYYFPTIGRMSGIEVIKGGSQIKNGPYTTGGAINFISTPIPKKLGGHVGVQGGSFNSLNMHAYVGNGNGQFDYLIEGFRYQSEGFKTLPNDRSTGFDKNDLMVKLRYHTSPQAKYYQSLTLKWAWANEHSNETYLGLTEADFATDPNMRYAGSQMDEMNTEHWQWQLKHKLAITPGLNLVTTIYHNDFSRNWYKLDKVSDASGESVKIASLLTSPSDFSEHISIVKGEQNAVDALHVKANNRAYYSQGLQSNLSWGQSFGMFQNTLETGLRIHRDEMDRFQWLDGYSIQNGVMILTDAGEPGTESNRIARAFAVSGFAQNRLSVGRISVIAGIRHENIWLEGLDYGKSDVEREGLELKTSENRAQAWIPGIGVDIEVRPGKELFAGIHRGFSPPGFNEDSDPESSVNYEAGGRIVHGKLQGQAVIFFNQYKNLLGSDLAAAGGSGTGELYNAGEVITRGFEANASTQMSHWVRTRGELDLILGLDYTYTDAKFQNSFESDFDAWGSVEEGDELPYIAHHQFGTQLQALWKQLQLNVNGKYTSQMRTQAGVGYDTPHLTDAQYLIDASLHFELKENVKLFTSVTNITNSSYIVARRPAGLRPGAPRILLAGFNWTW